MSPFCLTWKRVPSLSDFGQHPPQLMWLGEDATLAPPHHPCSFRALKSDSPSFGQTCRGRGQRNTLCLPQLQKNLPRLRPIVEACQPYKVNTGWFEQQFSTVLLSVSVQALDEQSYTSAKTSQLEQLSKSSSSTASVDTGKTLRFYWCCIILFIIR